jgi:primosomal protein N' (replication factor Y)
MPTIELVDLKDSKKKMIGHFSDVLIEAINTALSLESK